MISEEAMTYRCGAVLAILLNVLATAMFVSLVAPVYQSTPWTITVGAVCNLAGYLVLIGALRRADQGLTCDDTKTTPGRDV